MDKMKDYSSSLEKEILQQGSDSYWPGRTCREHSGCTWDVFALIEDVSLEIGLYVISKETQLMTANIRAPSASRQESNC